MKLHLLSSINYKNKTALISPKREMTIQYTIFKVFSNLNFSHIF